MKKQAIYILAALLLAGAVAGYWMYARRPPDVVQMSPHFTLPATDFTAAFEQDATAADERFNGKVIRVSGRVKSISNAGAVVLECEGKESEVVVGLDERHKEEAAKLRIGAHAVLQGVYSGFNQSAGGADDLLSGLGTTVQLRSAGLKKSNKNSVE